MHWITAMLLAVTAHAMTGGSVDAKFRGTWRSPHLSMASSRPTLPMGSRVGVGSKP